MIYESVSIMILWWSLFRAKLKNKILRAFGFVMSMFGEAEEEKAYKKFRNDLHRGENNTVASHEFTLRIRLRKILPRHQMHHRGFSEGKPKSAERDIAVQETTLVD